MFEMAIVAEERCPWIIIIIIKKRKTKKRKNLLRKYILQRHHLQLQKTFSQAFLLSLKLFRQD